MLKFDVAGAWDSGEATVEFCVRRRDRHVNLVKLEVSHTRGTIDVLHGRSPSRRSQTIDVDYRVKR